jgi:IS5 family transposase
MVGRGYIPHVRGRGEESRADKASPSKKPRRWVVEAAHSWFTRFRKLLVRYEKLERSFLALHHLAAAIIVYRKINAQINIIYG